jgi:hypothetical protein
VWALAAVAHTRKQLVDLGAHRYILSMLGSVVQTNENRNKVTLQLCFSAQVTHGSLLLQTLSLWGASPYRARRRRRWTSRGSVSAHSPSSGHPESVTSGWRPGAWARSPCC